MIELRKLMAPIPWGKRTRAAYGNVIIGNNKPVNVFIPFKMTLNLIELIQLGLDSINHSIIFNVLDIPFLSENLGCHPIDSKLPESRIAY